VTRCLSPRSPCRLQFDAGSLSRSRRSPIYCWPLAGRRELVVFPAPHHERRNDARDLVGEGEGHHLELFLTALRAINLSAQTSKASLRSLRWLRVAQAPRIAEAGSRGCAPALLTAAGNLTRRRAEIGREFASPAQGRRSPAVAGPMPGSSPAASRSHRPSQASRSHR
jgi:hypothetical protein